MILLPPAVLAAIAPFVAMAACDSNPVVKSEAVARNTTPSYPQPPKTALPPLPTQFSDIPASAYDCWNSYFGYTITRHWLYSEVAKSSTRIVTTFNPPRSGSATSVYTATTNCSTTALGLTTLCDGVPRATGRDINCITTPVTVTNSWIAYQSDVTVITPTWTTRIQNPYPSCGPAYNLKPECARMGSAYSYFLSSLRSNTISPTPSASRTSFSYAAAPPCTLLTSVPTPGAKPTCKMVVKKEDYSIYYWPTPSSPSSSLCPNPTNNSTMLPPPTKATPTKPLTAIVSGHTLTSPSIYHFLHSPTLSLFAGLAASQWGLGGLASSLWTTLPPSSFPTPLTVAQTEPILSASKTCRGIEADYCSVHLFPSFYISHATAAPQAAYETNCRGQTHCFARTCDGLCGEGTVWQDHYRATVAVPLREVEEQNSGGVLGDCVWRTAEVGDEDGWRSYSSSSFPAMTVGGLPTGAFVAIPTSAAGGAGEEERPGAMPGSRTGSGIVEATASAEV